MAKSKKVKDESKACFYCKKRTLIAEMELMGVWVCKECLKK